MAEFGGTSPLTISVDALLDQAVDNGWNAWCSTARNRPPESVAKWLAQRFPESVDLADARAIIAALTGDAPVEERAMTAAGLAELIEEDDPAFASLLWEAVQEAGHETSDAELLFEGASRLAAIEEALGDPLTAAEYLIAFLNWRREDHHASDAESVLTAFDEITRLAELDGAPAAAALFAFKQARFMRIVEEESASAEVGEWAPGSAPFSAWDSD